MDTPKPTVPMKAGQPRRGMIPTPDGAMPAPRRMRRGMVDLDEWDREATAYNQGLTPDQPANITPPVQTGRDVLAEIKPHLSPAALDQEAATETVVETDEAVEPDAEASAAEPEAPAANASAAKPDPERRESQGALIETPRARQQPDIPPNPEPNPEAAARFKQETAEPDQNGDIWLTATQARDNGLDPDHLPDGIRLKVVDVPKPGEPAPGLESNAPAVPVPPPPKKTARKRARKTAKNKTPE